jgi:hypothetical protein
MKLQKGFLSDKISYAGKTAQWRKDKVDYLCSQANTSDREDFDRMKRNYLLLNNVIDQKEYKDFCDPLGLDISEGKDYVEVFNLLANKVQVLIGEEMKRPWNYNVLSINPEATNEILREKQRDFTKYLRSNFKQEMAMINQENEQKIAMETGELEPKEAEKQVKALREKYAKEEADILNPNQIEKKYKKYRSVKETKMTHILKQLVINEKLKHVKNECFYHANAAGKEAVLIDIVNNETKITPLNPLGCVEHKSPEVEFYHNGDYFVYKQEMTIGDVLEQLQDELTDKDMKFLENKLNKVTGTDAVLMSKDGFSPSHFENLPNGGEASTVSIEHLGAHGQSSVDENYVTVYTTIWKSQRKIGFLIKPNGLWELYGEEFELPDNAVKEIKKEKVGRNKESYTWTDELGDEYSFEWKWLAEVWKGRRVEENIYGHIKPMEFQLRSKMNPNKVYLPVFGTSYNNYNAPILCTVDKMYPWQKLYFMVMSKWLKLIAKDDGVINLLNTLMIDPEIGIEKTMRYAKDTGMIPFNPLANSEGAGLVNTMKAGEKLDLSNTQQLSHYTSILQFIEQMIGTAAGIPPEREGRSSANSNVTDNQQDLMQSSHITEPFFAKHDLLWEDILNGAVTVEQFKFNNGKAHASRYILSDEELGMLTVEENEFVDDEYNVKIANNGKAHQDLQLLKQHANEIIQNEKNGLSTLVTLMGTDSVAEFKDYVLKIEQDISDREDNAASQQQAHEKELQEKLIEAREDEQAHDIAKIDRTGEWGVKKEEVKSFMGQMDQDSNDNGVPDQLEIDKLKIQSEENAKKAQLADKKIESDNYNEAENRKLKDKEIAVKKIQANKSTKK